MKRIVAVSLFLCFLGSATTARADAYEVQPAAGSRFALTVEKTGLYRGKKHLFLFEKYEGRLDYDAAQPEASKIALTIDSASVVCMDDWVSSGDLKKIMETTLEDMLAVKRYPSMEFTSATIKPLGGDRFEAQGTLTIRGIAKPVTIMVALNAANKDELRLDGESIIRLKDYKLDPPSALFGVIGTKNEMTLNFTVAAMRVE